MERRDALLWRAGLAMLPPAGATYLRLVHATMRLRRAGVESALPDDDGPVIYSFWHAQLVMMPWMQFRPPTVAPISRSRDGEITSRLFAKLQVQSVRGSSSRGGASAARGMVAAIRGGLDAGLTPDGPRGPAREVQPGATWVAKATGRPLLPVAFACSRSLRLGSWDRMMVPLPFGRGVFVYGDLLWVPSDSDSTALTRADDELGERMDAVSERALRILKR